MHQRTGLPQWVEADALPRQAAKVVGRKDER
jgi:hypothetical protein